MTQAAKPQMRNWNDLPREFVRKGVERAGFRGEQCIMVMNWATPGMDLRPHTHEFEQIAICIKGRMNYHVGDQVFDMTPGSMVRVPAHTLHYAEPVGDEVVMNLDVFAPLRADYAHLVEYQKAEFEPANEAAEATKG